MVYYYRSPEHRGHYVLSFTFAFDREEEMYHFALCRPYSYSRCQAHLDQLERKGFPHLRREALGVSLVLVLLSQIPKTVDLLFLNIVSQACCSPRFLPRSNSGAWTCSPSRRRPTWTARSTRGSSSSWPGCTPGRHRRPSYAKVGTAGRGAAGRYSNC